MRRKITTFLFNQKLKYYSNELNNYITKHNIGMNESINIYLDYLHIFNVPKYNSLKECLSHLGTLFKKSLYTQIKEEGINEEASINTNIYNDTVLKLDEFILDYCK